MITRDRIFEIIFEKVIIAALLAFSGSIIISLFSIYKERAEFAAKYAATNVEIRSSYFKDFSDYLEKIEFLVASAVGIPNKREFLESPHVSKEVSLASIKIDRILMISHEGGEFTEAIKECKVFVQEELNSAAIGDITPANAKQTLSDCYSKTAKHLSQWLSEGALTSYDAAIEAARQRYPLRAMIGSDGVVISFVALLVTSLLVLFTWLKVGSGAGVTEEDRLDPSKRRKAKLPSNNSARNKNRFAFRPEPK